MFEDKEFGEVKVRRNALARRVNFSIATSGRLQMTVPRHYSDAAAKRCLNRSRAQIRTLPLKDPATQRARDAKAKLLVKQAKQYLPYRLDYWARKYGYHYDELKISHAGTRWGSCTHRTVRKGLRVEPSITIALNPGLMQVPEVLRDYVIIHELAHINHPDHSAAFWAEVGEHDPRYKEHRKKLKMFSPGV